MGGPVQTSKLGETALCLIIPAPKPVEYLRTYVRDERKEKDDALGKGRLVVSDELGIAGRAVRENRRKNIKNRGFRAPLAEKSVNPCVEHFDKPLQFVMEVVGVFEEVIYHSVYRTFFIQGSLMVLMLQGR